MRKKLLTVVAVFILMIVFPMVSIAGFWDGYTFVEAKELWGRPFKYVDKQIVIYGKLYSGKGTEEYYSFSFISPEDGYMNPFTLDMRVDTENMEFADKVYDNQKKNGYWGGILKKTESGSFELVEYIFWIDAVAGEKP